MSSSEKLIERQLRTLGLSKGEVPVDVESWKKFLSKVEKAYAEAEQDRYLLERSLEISSREMHERWLELHTSEARKNSILTASIDAIICFDAIGEVIEFNQAAETAFGFTRQGKYNIGQYLELKISVPSFGRRTESVARRTDGATFPVETVLTPIQQEDNITYCVFIRDLSEQKESQRLILDQQLKIISVERLASLGQMAANIAHEINNPLAILTLSLSAIKRRLTKLGVHSDDINEKIMNMEETLLRISRIITGLRNISRDNKEFKKEAVPVRTVLTDVIGLVTEKMRSQGIDLRCDLTSPVYETRIRCDRVQLSQVLINVLSNAFDAVELLDEKWIEVSFRSTETHHEIRIADSGPGIPPEVHFRMFEPFYTSKVIGKGTGLGLSISRSIMERHEGNIDVDTQQINTTFVLRLPV